MTSFDDIRSYNESEIPVAMQRISEAKELSVIMNNMFPGTEIELLRARIRNIKTTKQFQTELVVEMVDHILQGSSTGFDTTGLENIDKNKPCLFISNHRDIVLDAMLLQYALIKAGLETSHIAFGDNLLMSPLINDFWKVNKMFQMGRGGHPKAFYNSLLHTSEYIRYLLLEKGESVWIAQRNGRTKNGLDVTDPALVKMLGLGWHNRGLSALAEMNIMPVSVSYEWESCDKLKTIELCISRHQKYEKKAGEDLNSILTGIKQPKGRIHFHICPVVTEADLESLNDCAAGLFYKRVAGLIDRRIYSAYKFFPNNFIAHDLRSGTETYVSRYTTEQKAQFLHYMEWMYAHPELDREEMKSIFLGIYANPIDSLNNSK